MFSFPSVEDESKNCVSSGSGGGAIVGPISRLPLLTIFYTITRRNTALLIGHSLIVRPLIGQGSVAHLYH